MVVDKLIAVSYLSSETQFIKPVCGIRVEMEKPAMLFGFISQHGHRATRFQVRIRFTFLVNPALVYLSQTEWQVWFQFQGESIYQQLIMVTAVTTQEDDNKPMHSVLPKHPINKVKMKNIWCKIPNKNMVIYITKCWWLCQRNS